MRGFTLIEILIAVAIIAILASIVLTSLSSFKGAQALSGIAEDALSIIHEARQNTLSSKDDSVYGVHFESNSITLFKGLTYSEGNVNNEVTSVESSVVISDISLYGSGSDVIFNRLTGETDQYGTVTFQLTSDATSEVIITLLKSGATRKN